MTVAAYRDRASGRYPVYVPEIRERAGALFGDEPPSDVLASLSLDPVQAVAVPSHDASKQSVAEGAPVQSGGIWKQTWIISTLPPKPIVTWKSDIWRRCTQEEAAILDNALSEAPVKDRRAWDDATQIISTAPEFADFRAQMVLAFGEARTAQILAPSEM